MPVPASEESFQYQKEFHVSAYSGAAVHAYSLVVPPGTNGLQPSVSLVYSSHSSNSLENVFGSGWYLNQSFIERDVSYTPGTTGDDVFYLNLQNERHKLVYDGTAGFYKTLINNFAKVEQATGSANNAQGNYWQVTTPDGTKLRFGHESNSEEVCSDRSYVRRWYLDLVTDTNDNNVFYTYQETGNYSYLDKIEYNNEKKRVVDFTYEATSNDRIGTLSGCRAQQTQRLDEVDVVVDSTLHKTYSFAYEANDTSHNLLSSVTETDASSNTLPATTFSYHDEVRQWSTSPQTWYNNSGNGDLSLDFKQTKLLDVNGDNYPDIVWYHPDGSDRVIDVYKNTGSSWQTTSENWYDSSTYPEVDLTSDNVRLADVTGDSLPDIVFSKQLAGDEREFYVLPNTGTAWSTTAQNWYDSTNDPYLYLVNTGVEIVDVNGDGKADLVRNDWYEDSGTKYRLKVYLNTGSAWSTTSQNWLVTPLQVMLHEEPPEYFDTDADEIPDTVAYYNSRSRIIDVTNDGLPDVLYTEPYNTDANRRWHVFINTGDSWDNTSQNWLETSAEFDLQNLQIAMFDANGDGYPDIVKGEKYDGPWHRWKVWLNEGDGWSTSAVEFLDNDDDPQLGLDQNNIAVGDVNGDGYIDLVSSEKSSGSQRIWKVTLNNGYAGNKLSQTKNSSGGTTSLSYTPSTAYDNTGADSQNDLIFPMWLISESTQNNGMTGTHQRIATMAYSYKDGLYDVGDRDLRGFNQVTLTDARGKNVHLFHQDDARKSKEYETQHKALNDTLYKKVQTTWSNTLSNGIYTVLPSNVINSLYDGNVTPLVSQTNYTYDSYGNPTVIEETADNVDDRVTNFAYTYNTSSWLVSYPKRTWKEDESANKLSETFIYYDGNASVDTAPTKGNVTKEEKWHDRGANSITTYTYDSYGNQLTVTDPNNNTTITEFGTTDTTFTHPDSTTNALTQETTYTFSLATGNILSVTDSNGYVTSYQYDGFGRLTKVIKPYDNSTDPTVKYTYTFDGNAPEIVTTEQMLEASVSAKLTKIEVSDGYGQAIQVKQSAEDPTKQVISNLFYDFRGNPAGQSNPYIATASATYVTPDTNQPRSTLSYDLLDRLTEFENPDETTRQTTYNKNHINYTDERTNDIDHYLNGFGEITLIEEHVGTDTYETEYDYDARGNLVQIKDDQDNVTLFTYDSMNRQIGLTDPDMGTWLYYYDKNGNLGTVTDNRGITVFSQYDDLNRITLKDFPSDPDEIYTYDDPVDGTLSEVTTSTSSYTISYEYDQRLRQAKETKQYGSITANTSRFYNSADQVRGMTYPDGQFVAFAINKQGLVDSVGSIVPNIDYTAAGKVAEKDYANSLTTTYTYDPETLRMSAMETGALQDLTYVYDTAGNITGYDDSTTGTDKTFTYDSLNRLLTATDPLNNDISHSYDSVGNLVSLDFNGNVYQFEYGLTGGPHSLSAGNFTSPLGFELPAFKQPQTSHSYGYYFSFELNDTVGGVSLTPQDIGVYNDVAQTWAMYFDGSDVGITSAIDGIELLEDGSILLSFAGNQTLAWGTVPKQDIVRFIPTSVGATTDGVFELYFDASAVGLSSTFADMFAITRASDKDLLVTDTLDDYLYKFIPTGLKHVTAGTTEDFFDGSDTGIVTDDVTAAYFDYLTNKMYIADDDDTNLHTCILQIPGSSTECTNDATITTSGWGVDKTITGFHYYNNPNANKVPNEPDLIEGVYVSGDGSDTVGGVSAAEEDIIFYDLATNAWSMFIDGSDVSLNSLTSFHVREDGTILMSFIFNQTLSFGTATPQDVVKFTPSSTGTTTAGTFEMYFDGSDVSLTIADLITGISETTDGKLLITLDDRKEGNPAWGDVNVAYKFNHTSLGNTTAGTMVRYFEGDDVNLFHGYTSLDSSPNDNLYLTPDAHASMKNITTVAGKDILRCQPTSLGDFTSCQFGIIFASESSGYTGDIDGMTLKYAQD